MKEYYTVAELSNNEHMNERSGRVDSPETESARHSSKTTTSRSSTELGQWE